MKNLLLTPALVLLVTVTMAQQLSRREADVAANALRGNIHDTTRASILLKLASYNLLKAGEKKQDLDSAAAFIRQAIQLNSSLRSVELAGNILLSKAYLSKERGEKNKKPFALAIQTLEMSKDKYHLALAEIGLAKFYHSKNPVERPQKMLLQSKALSLLQTSGTIEQKKYGLLEAKNDKDFIDSADLGWKVKFLSQMSPIIYQLMDKQYELNYRRDLADLHLKQGNAVLAEKELLQMISDFGRNKGVYLANTYDLLAGVYQHTQDFNKALTNELLAIKIIDLQNTKDLEASYLRLCDIYESLKRFDDYIVIKKKLASLYHMEHKPPMECLSFKDIAWAHLQQGKTRLAEREFADVLKNYVGKDHNLPINTYGWLIIACQKNGNYKESLRYALEAMQTPTSAADSTYFSWIYTDLANTYFTLDMKAESREALYLLHDFYVNSKQTDRINYPVRQIASLFVLEGKPSVGLKYIIEQEKKYPPVAPFAKKLVALGKAQCYEALKQNGKAGMYIDQAIHYFKVQKTKSSNDPDFNTDYLIGGFYTRTGQYAKAKVFLEAALKEQERENTSNSVRQINVYLFKIDSASGNFISAIRYLQRSQQLKDATFDLSKNKEIQRLSIAYGTEQKKKDIKILHDKDKLQSAQLNYAEKTRNWIVAASGLLLLLLGVSYNMYRSKRRSNTQLQEQRQKIITINEDLKELVSEKDGLILQKDHLITEKEWLLKEVHHRVKNNLHTVICLLESQAAYLENDALKAIESSQHRIYAMSLIHQKLYQMNDTKTIDMSVYIPELIQYLNDSFGMQKHVHFQLAIEKILLGVSQAIPLALIINEAVTNSIKYAFKPDRLGLITIVMNQIDKDITLVISDNGIGISPDIADKPRNSLGLKLMNGLSEDINAYIKFKNHKGTRIEIQFNIDPLIVDTSLSNSLASI